MSEAWTRLLGRTLAKRASPKVKEHLVPQQLGISVPGGVEVAAHLIQVAVQSVKQQAAEGDLVVQTSMVLWSSCIVVRADGTRG